MKKIGIVMLMLMICCGCNAKYQLELNDKHISEQLNVSYPRTNESNEEIEQIYKNYLYAINRDSFYEFNNKSTNNNINLSFNYDYRKDNLNNSNLIKSCVEYFDFFEEDNKIYLTATGAFKCSFYEYIKLESLDISIKTNNNVLENNADEIKDNEYIWHVDLGKLNNINIRLITDNKENPEIKKKEYKNIFITVGIASIILLLVSALFFIKHKRVNKI